MLTINDPGADRGRNGFALFNLGFRPFFIGAAACAVASMTAWALVYFSRYHINLGPIPASLWHAHEMVFGYALAVIAGFLLTAVRNWTGVATPTGLLLVALLGLWALARILMLAGPGVAPVLLALADCGFAGLLLLSIARPIVMARQWKHGGILLVVLLMFTANLVFYLGVFRALPQGMGLGVYAGVYFVLMLIFIMARRVIPFFIEKGAGEPVTVTNYHWLDIAVIALFLLYVLMELLAPFSGLTPWLAGALFVLHGIRLAGWFVRPVLRKPMLWVLLAGYSFLVLGFGLRALQSVTDLSPLLVLHAFAAGGIGMITLGMMARVALGHTGRSVIAPPRPVAFMFGVLLSGALVRVVMPLLAMQHYAVWIGLSQVLWIVAFGLFLWVYVPMLIRPRVDGRPG